jgi:hypothetical protein
MFTAKTVVELLKNLAVIGGLVAGVSLIAFAGRKFVAAEARLLRRHVTPKRIHMSNENRDEVIFHGYVVIQHRQRSPSRRTRPIRI